jgi:hypothetical protein
MRRLGTVFLTPVVCVREQVCEVFRREVFRREVFRREGRGHWNYGLRWLVLCHESLGQVPAGFVRGGLQFCLRLAIKKAPGFPAKVRGVVI